MAPGEKSINLLPAFKLAIILIDAYMNKSKYVISVTEMLPSILKYFYGFYFGNSFIFAFLGSEGAE